MTSNRIEEILREVRAEIDQKRASGAFPEGYEAGIEEVHNRELGKRISAARGQADELQVLINELHLKIERLSEIERDKVKFPPLRFIRELAMSRHQLIRLNQEVRGVALTIQLIAKKISALIESDLVANETKNLTMLTTIYERSLVMDKMVVLASELETRLNALENK